MSPTSCSTTASLSPLLGELPPAGSPREGDVPASSRAWQVGTRLSPIPLPTDIGKEVTPRKNGETLVRIPSKLLQRRRSEPLVVDIVQSPSRSRFRRSQTGFMPPEPRPMEKDIQPLPEGAKIFDLYHWDEVLQEEGDGGKVVVCQQKVVGFPSGEKFVMKIRSKASLVEQHTEEQFRKAQLRMLNLPPHSGVLPLVDVFEDEKFYYIVMEKASGGSFFGSLVDEFRDGVMPAEAVQKLMREILEAVSHVHKQGILHRDIKPDNLVVQLETNPDGGPPARRVALIDFDHADPEWDPNTPAWQNSFHGTVAFSAPETFQGYFSQSSDIYSVGVILYLLMAGKMPYDGDIYAEELIRKKRTIWSRYNWKEAVFRRMREARIDWDCNPWPEQPLCRDFCQALLAFEPSARPSSADEALGHAWLTQL